MATFNIGAAVVLKHTSKSWDGKPFFRNRFGTVIEVRGERCRIKWQAAEWGTNGVVGGNETYADGKRTWVNAKFIEATEAGPIPLTVFEIYPGGDPFSKTWEATEHTPTGPVFRGDLAHLFNKVKLAAQILWANPKAIVVTR